MCIVDSSHVSSVDANGSQGPGSATSSTSGYCGVGLSDRLYKPVGLETLIWEDLKKTVQVECNYLNI